jgi:SAM-dependent methyltransferase
MPEFSLYDSRGYRTLDPRHGYAEWSARYEDDVVDEMDIPLLDELAEVDWHGVGRAVDLGCGTGRTGAWLRAAGVPAIDGVDLTPEMLAVARRRGSYDRLVEGDVRATGLPGEAYDLAVSSLVDEHLPDPGPLHAEAWRLAEPGAAWVLVSFHPQWIIATGMPTHFERPDGEPVAIATHVNLISEQVSAALQRGWRLTEMRERLIDDRWLAAKPQWEIHRGKPVSVAYVWRKPTDAG